METTILRSDGSSRTEDGNVIAFSRPTEGARTEGDPHVLGRRRVAIVGFAPSTLKVAVETVFIDPTWRPDNREMPSEIWGLNELYKVPGVSHAERWFDIHDRRDGDVSLRDPGNIAFLRAATIPIFMQDRYPDIPASVAYPIRQVCDHFRTNYFTNTISYMMALAIMEGRDGHGWVVDGERAFGEIQVYGVDMAQDAAAYSEYREQRPSVEFFLGWARAIGIKLYVPPASDLLKTTFMYGFEGTGMAIKAKMNARRSELQTQINAYNAQAQAKIAEANQLQARSIGLSGALEDTNYWDRCWIGTGPEPYKLEASGKLLTFEGLAVNEEAKKEAEVKG